jgi:polyhydroxyalkanoate synthesis regulator phasin
LEKDVKRLKEKAELDSSRIIAQARQEAAAETQRLIEKAREEAGEITRQSSEEGARARQESAGLMAEARERAQKIISEIVECGTALTQRELARQASEAKNKTSQLLKQFNQSLAQIMDENENSFKAELDRLSGIISEAEKRLQIETSVKAVETNPVKAGSEVHTASAAEKEKIQPMPAFPVKTAPGAVKESDEARLFRGRLELEIIPRFNQEQTGGVPESLARLTGSKLIPTGGYASGNRRISTFSLDLAEPVPLLKMIRTLNVVKDVEDQRGIIVVTL